MQQYANNLKQLEQYDVVVCGGGPAGFSAALSAARNGMRVLVLELKHQLGGTGTSGMVSHWLGGRQVDGSWVVGGVFKELSREAAARGIALIPDPADYADRKYAPHGIFKGSLLAGVPFDPFSMATLIEQTLIDAGVEIRYESVVVDVVTSGDTITHVITADKDGLTAVPARVFVDATGDADVAARAGARYVVGDEEGKPMVVSLMMHLEDVNEPELMEYVTSEDDPRFRKKLALLRSRNINCFTYEIIIFVKMNRDGYFMINGRGLSDIYGQDPASRTQAYVTERAKVDETVELFRAHWPGCRDVRLRAVASSLGVRETRRVEAHGYMTVDDVLDGRRFPDTIGYTAYGWDITKGKGDRDPKSLRKPEVIPIPYSLTVPKAFGNLICPGRAINCERIVLGPMRVQAPIMAMGHAAGAASALAIRNGTTYSDVDLQQLRTALSDEGAIVEL